MRTLVLVVAAPLSHAAQRVAEILASVLPNPTGRP
jgi:hypothetical protein